jgi:hypothetical protein
MAKRTNTSTARMTPVATVPPTMAPALLPLLASASGAAGELAEAAVAASVALPLSAVFESDPTFDLGVTRT